MFLENFDKGSIRKSVFSSRKNIDTSIKAKMDLAIFNNLISTEEYKSCGILLVYVSKPTEVETRSIINFALKENKIVATPRCSVKESMLVFHKISSLSDLEKSHFGIFEPIEEKCEKIHDFSCGLCVVPGLCFDYFGNRIGYGKGYYDKFLKSFKGRKVGICHSDCVFEKLPTDPYDEKMDLLITEKNILEVIV